MCETAREGVRDRDRETERDKERVVVCYVDHHRSCGDCSRRVQDEAGVQERRLHGPQGLLQVSMPRGSGRDAL